MALKSDDIREVAALARLDLTDDEVRSMVTDLSRILEYVDQLSELDTAGVTPTAHAVELTNVMREDTPGSGLRAEEALANAPDRSGSFFRVPRVLQD